MTRHQLCMACETGFVWTGRCSWGRGGASSCVTCGGWLLFWLRSSRWLASLAFLLHVNLSLSGTSAHSQESRMIGLSFLCLPRRRRLCVCERGCPRNHAELSVSKKVSVESEWLLFHARSYLSFCTYCEKGSMFPWYSCLHAVAVCTDEFPFFSLAPLQSCVPLLQFFCIITKAYCCHMVLTGLSSFFPQSEETRVRLARP